MNDPATDTSAGFIDLDRYLTEEVARVEDGLDRAVSRWHLGASGLPEDVGAALRHGVLGGGKRLRPVLCVAAHTACGGARSDALYDLAGSIELIHAYSLMHDDLPCMDDAELRRGRSTTHRAHGEDPTMRAGAALIPIAALEAVEACTRLGCDAEHARKVSLCLMEAAGAGGMVGGQWLDLLGEERVLDAAALDELHGRKTGALLTASLAVGALAARADATALQALVRYGRAIGLAFQIADDILDVTESAETLGKNPSDADLDKSTYVALHGLGAARARASSLVDDAVGALAEVGLESPALVALAHYVVKRGR